MLVSPMAHQPVEALGLTFPNRLGLAAGYDKNGLAWQALSCFGFGHLELGTSTPLPQDGNPKPRMFMLGSERAFINRLGCPGRGVEFLARRLVRGERGRCIVGVNIAKNNDTPLNEAEKDYVFMVRRLYPLADYLTINVSSPNSAEVRRLQGRRYLERLLQRLDIERCVQERKNGYRIPLLVKLSPDLSSSNLDHALEAIMTTGMDGVIASNTTTCHEGMREQRSIELGGLSGAPLRQQSTDMVRAIYHRTSGKIPIIGVGGIMSPDDAKEKIDAGATLVQLYTGLVYGGIPLIRNILKHLASQLPYTTANKTRSSVSNKLTDISHASG